MNNREINILSPFGPKIAQIKIPSDIIVKLNDYVDKIINNEEKSNALNYGEKLAGNVKQEFKLEEDFMEEVGWGKFLGEASHKWIEVITGEKITKFNIISSWIVRQFKNEYNPIHWHGGHISGVGYLKVPKTFGDQVQKNKTHNYNGHLQLIHGSRMFLSQSKISFKPEVGNFYLFPNYLMHSVYPFSDTNEERRSISFNANINPNIYDVYAQSK